MAAVRLRDVVAESAGLVTVSWKSMPLRLGDRPARPSPHSVEGRMRARAEEPRIPFRLEPPASYPTSSLPALQAGKCAQLQGDDSFERMHLSLFNAYFELGEDISSRDVLGQVARDAGLDEKRFWADMDSGQGRAEVMGEFREFLAEYSGFGIPLAVFPDGYPVQGAVPTDYYRQVVQGLRRGQSTG